MSILTIFLSFFMSFFHDFKIIDESVEELVFTFGEFEIKEIHSMRYLYYNDILLEEENTMIVSKYFLESNRFVIFSWNTFTSDVVIRSYSLNGSRQTKIIFDNKIVGDFDVALYDDMYYLVGGVNSYTNSFFYNAHDGKNYLLGMNNVLFSFDSNFSIKNVRITGGVLDEFFYKITVSNEFIYVVGYKETLSGYDFGNGGGEDFGYILATYNHTMSLLDYVVTDEEIVDFFNINNKNVLITKNQIHQLNNDLNTIISLKLPSTCIFASVSKNNCLLILSQDKLKIYDLSNMKLLNEYLLSQNINRALYYNDVFYLIGQDQIHKLIIYDYDSFKEQVVYDDVVEMNEVINGWNFQYKLLNKIYLNVFDPLVNGDYQVLYDYGAFEIEGTVKVLERANVTDGNIYSVGYCLLFSGRGYLNDILIYNNHQITAPGNYTLKLYDQNSNCRIINFFVEYEQINFYENDNKNWDYELSQNEELFFSFTLNQNNVSIERVVVNDEDWPYTYVDRQINLCFSEKNSGLYYYDVKMIEYSLDGEMYYISIDKQLKIKILENDLSITSYISDNTKVINYKGEVQDSLNMLRYVKIKIIGNSEQEYCLSLKSQKIVLTLNKSLENPLVYVCLVFDNGSKQLGIKTLLNMQFIGHFDVINIGEIIMHMRENTTTNFTLKILKTSGLERMFVQNKEIYAFQKTTYIASLLIGIGVMVITIISGLFIYKKEFRLGFKRKIK